MQANHFLAAIDIQPQHESVLARAFELAREHGGRLTVLHVAHAPDAVFLQSLDEPSRDGLRRLALDAARESIATALQPLPAAGVDWNLVVETGSPSGRIVETADALGARLVILGANRRRSLRDRMLGSTADRVVRTAAQPVLVVRRPAERPYRKVIVATDFSSCSAAAAAAAVELFPQGSLQLVHVLHVPLQMDQAMIQAGRGTAIAGYRRELQARARKQLAQAASGMEAAGCRPRTRLLEGEPGGKLVRLAASRTTDLIVVGARGHGMARRALLGSIAHRLLRSVACDVLVVGAAAAAVGTAC